MELSDRGMSMVKSAIGNSPVDRNVQDNRNHAVNATLKQTTETTLFAPIPAKFNSLNSLVMSFRLQANTSGAANFFKRGNFFFNLFLICFISDVYQIKV